MDINIKFMKLAINLAKKGIGYVNPNPMVGAVIVKDEKIIGQGWHEKYGGDHAEINALKDAKLNNYSDCTLYITLEPCSHFGKTPPCSDAIIEAGFKKVFVAMLDPNPLVAGSGVEKLRNAGIDIEVGILAEEAKWLNRSFIKFITTGKSYNILKVAMSADGFVTTEKGESQWITSEESRTEGHRLRAYSDAILVGRNTAEQDDPRLNVRNVAGRDPFRVVLDTDLKLPLTLKLFRDNTRQKTILFCSQRVANIPKAETLRVVGVKVEPVELNENGSINIIKVLDILAQKYKMSVIMIEGGAIVNSYFINNNLADEIQLFIAPMIFGSGKKAFENVTSKYLKDVRRYKTKYVAQCGNDAHFIMVRND